MSQLEFSLMGAPRLTLDGAEVELTARKPAALLYYLAVTAEIHTRDKLAALLWPEHDQSGARANIRRALWNLKQAGFEPWLSITREAVALKPGYQVDVHQFRQALDAGHQQQATGFYRDDFLAGFTLPDSPEFDDWQFFLGEQLRADLRRALAELSEEHSSRGEYAPAIDYARRLLAMDPLQEEAHRRLMELYARDGQHAAALRQYDECARLLEEELGLQPEPATRELAEQIRHRSYGPPPISLGTGSLLLDRYRLGQVIGKGGMGVVYRATDQLLERSVAVKVLTVPATGEEQHARLLAEARSAARLNHPNIVAVYDAGVFGDQPFIVMEMVEGSTLRERGELSLEEALEAASQIAAALDHAHQHGIIHRDLKPENAIFAPDGSAKLTDFGLASEAGRTRLTEEGILKGTIAYIAPELILGQPAEPVSDLYALGVLLYELVARRLPFEGQNPAVLLSNHLHAPVLPPSAYNPEVTPALDALITQLLEKEPERRPTSAREVVERLDELGDAKEEPYPRVVPAASLLNRIARGRLVGRVVELGEATHIWLQALSGQARLLLVSGEPGIGKTRLAQAIIAQARAGGAAVLSGGSYEFEATTPYLPLAEALRQWVGRQDDETLRAQIGPQAPELARLAPEIDTRLGPLTPGPSLEPEEQRLRLFDNVAQFLDRQAGESGLLLFLDDLHWVDRGTLSLLSYLLRRLRRSRLLVVGAYREVELDRAHPLADALVQWARERLATRVQLARFSEAETNRLIATLFGQERVSDEFAGLIHQETEGNPFFIEEVVKSLVEQGQIYWSEAGWERADIQDLAIPQSVREAIGRRLNRLSLRCVETLHTAAVIGKDFPYALLAAVSGADEEAILEDLEEAAAAQLIRPLAGEAFVFTHDKIREVLYDEILTVRRHRLHRQIVGALEAGASGDPAAHVEELAHHAISGGNLDKGFTYAMQAAGTALQVFAAEEALDYYRQARECAFSLGDTRAQSKVLEAMGDVYATISPLQAAIDHYREAASLAPSDQERAAILVKMGDVYTILGDDQGVAILNEALEMLDPDTQPLVVATGLAGLGRFKHYRRKYSAAIELFHRAHELAAPRGDPPTLSRIHSYLAGAYQHMVHMEESMRWAHINMEMGEKQDYLPAVALGHEFVAEDLVILGCWDRSIAASSANREVGEKIGWIARVGWADWCTGHALCGKGELTRAASVLIGALELAVEIGEPRLAILCGITLSMVQVDLGKEKDALENCQKALDQSRNIRELFQEQYAEYAFGYVLLQLGRWKESIGSFKRAVAEQDSNEARDVILHSLPYYAEALLHLGREGESAQLVERALDLAREVGAPHYEAVALRVQGQLLIQQGEFSEAEAAFEQASVLADEVGSRLELGRIHFQRAINFESVGKPESARQSASTAKALFDKCGAALDLEKARRLLNRLA